MDSEIEEYIREHYDTYTREAITRHLIEAGHSRQAIEAAWWRLVDRAPAAEAEQPQPRWRWRRFWIACLGFVVGLLVLTNLLNAITLVFGLFFYPAALLTALIYAIVNRQTDQDVAAGLLCGLAVVVMLFFVAPGLCTVMAPDL